MKCVQTADGIICSAIYVLSRNMKNIRVFLSEIFQFLEVKFSIHLNSRVFVMHKVPCKEGNAQPRLMTQRHFTSRYVHVFLNQVS